jgi:hypothetical protein
VRPLAWRLALRRHAARLFHRSRGVDESDRPVLDALARLPVAQRRVLVLTRLAAVPLERAAPELNLTEDAAAALLRDATASAAADLGVDPAGLPGRLEALDRTAGTAVLPRASAIRRAGRKRRQSHTLIAVMATAVLAVTSGVVVYEPAPTGAAPRTDRPLRVEPSVPETTAPDPARLTPSPGRVPTEDMLLDADQVRRLGPARDWTVEETHDNTGGDGINTVCQQARFADPDGLSTLVRTFRADGRPRRSAVQTVETSRSVPQAKQTFRTTVHWYADCQQARLQLLTAYRVTEIGEQATMLLLRAWDRPVTTYSVAVARIGQLTTSTVSKTVAGHGPAPRQVVQSLADSVSMLCASSVATACPHHPPEVTRVPPPEAGDEPGMLAGIDLPPVGSIDKPWVGTDAAPAARTNPAATSCDRARFGKGGAQRTRTRTFLIPQARLPDRFGLSETYGEFGSTQKARAFVRTMRDRLDRCGDHHLAVHARRTLGPGDGDPPHLWTWLLRTEVTAKKTVTFRVAFVRVGDTVAQVTFSPTATDDLSAVQFRDLAARAGDRLRELP